MHFTLYHLIKQWIQIPIFADNVIKQIINTDKFVYTFLITVDYCYF